jgi:hypothetical protein
VALFRESQQFDCPRPHLGPMSMPQWALPACVQAKVWLQCCKAIPGNHSSGRPLGQQLFLSSMLYSLATHRLYSAQTGPRPKHSLRKAKSASLLPQLLTHSCAVRVGGQAVDLNLEFGQIQPRNLRCTNSQNTKVLCLWLAFLSTQGTFVENSPC